MASNSAAAPPLSELSGALEELRRQLASVTDAQVATEVGHHHQTVLSNIMLTGQENGQVAPTEDLEKSGSGVAKAGEFTPVSNFKSGADHNTSPGDQTPPATSALDQISGGSDFVGYHTQAPFNGQILTPDLHLAQAAQPAAIPQSQAEQFSPKVEEPQTAIVDTNDDPVAVVPIADQSTNEDAGFSFTVPPYSFIDVDEGDSLTLSATLADGNPLPAWLVFDPATQTFSGTPLNDDVGALTIRVTATDTSGATATQDFQVTVINTNDGPVAAVDIADQSTNEDAGFSFTVAPNSFSDVDVGDSLTLSATLADGSPLPAWLSFDPGTQTFSGTPLNGDIGSLTIRVTATDTAGATATQDFQIAVNNSNDGPVASVLIPDQSTNEDAGFNFTVAPNSFSDVDVGDTLTLSATLADGSPLPAWLSFDPATQTFSGTPLNDDVGALTIRVTATDTSGASATQDFQVTVNNTNDGPVASAVIADQSTNEDAGFNFTVPSASFADVDVGDTLTLSATLADGSPLPAWLSFDPGTNSFSGTPLNDDVGALTIRVTATDTSGASATQDFTVTVNNTNDGPVASVLISDQSTNEDAGFSFTVPAASFTDVDAGDTLTLSATLADGSPLPTWLSFDPGTNSFSGTPLNGDVGALTIRVTATDTAGATATQDFTVTVANTNDAPVASVTIANQATNEDAGFSFTVPASSFSDVDVGDTLTLSATLADGSALPAWLSFDPGTQTFSGTPLNDDVGSLAIRVTATDTSGASATQDFTVTVNNTNDAPVITSSNAASFAENSTGTVYTAAATDVDVGTTLTYSISGTDAALFNIDSVTGAVTFKSSPNYEAPGDLGGNNVYDVTIGVSDGTVTTTKDVAIGVTNVNEAPVVTSAATANFAENGTGTVYTAAATDPDAGSTLTYSISGADAALFNINATTGAVTFKSSPNYEAPADAGGNNVYDIKVAASDGTFTATKDVAISVTNVNEAPNITSGASASFAENASGTVYTVAATDPDAGTTLTYSLTGTDAARFNINSTTGAITFKSSPNYEAPTDAGANNVYDVTVRASDGTNITTQAVAITVTNVNEAPVITSAATASFAENGAGTVYTAAATDVDAGTTLTYSLSGTDAALFNINATTGAITFKSSPNYEAPTDSGANNVYNVTVGASDGALTTTKAVAITVTNVAGEVPVFTSGGSANFAENAAGTVYTAAATPDAGKTLTYSLSGSDASLFNINATTGVVTFKSSPNYEAPADAGGNNVYDVKVTASDGTNSATKDVAISVTNVNEAPVITSGAAASFAENASGTVYTVAATDQDAGTTLTYSLTGTDAARFNIDATTGAITFKSTPNYEAPTDSGANNVYDVTVRASDGVNTTSKAVAITVTNVNEAPTITSAATKSFAENATGTVYTATATDPDAGTTLTYSISGADAALFDINATTGVVTFKSSPNFEAPADAGANNVYDITVGASDGTNTTTKAVAITVTNINEAPTITSGVAASFAENATGTVYTVAATDQDAGATLTYSLTGTDAARFNINATTGAITFKSSPNYEAPTDAGANNVYDVTVRASDGTNITTKNVAITVTNVNEAPIITSAATASFAENGTGTVYTAAATDPDAGTTLTYSLTGTDAALFNINATTGLVTFKSAPNYEAPADSGKNNVYDITVGASDGSVTTTKAVAVTVTNVAGEAPAFTSGGAANFAENATGTVYTATAIPESGKSLTYSLTGADASLFNINATTGVVTFKSSPNYEAPGDAGGNNVYDINVKAFDGTNSSTQAVAISVTNVNEAPTVTSAATASVGENAAGTVYTVAATDPDAGTALTYSLSGTDAALFDINSTTGAITFKSAPNYEAPTDAGANNVYNVTVAASDGTLTTTKAVAITVTNVNEAPTITSGDAASFAEAGTGTVYTVAATDPDAGATITYSLTGTDAALFNINATTGAVTFKSAPNYQAPADAGGDNIYDVTVRASDGTNITTKAVAISVTDVNEAPTFTSGGAASFAENATGTVYAAAATDPDAGTTLTYSLSGADAALFNIDATTGVITFKSAPNYEAPGDAGGNNVYDVNVTASDGTNATTQAVAITVTNVNEAPTVTSGAAANFAENAAATVYTAAATDVDAGTTLTYSLSGADAALFDINATTGAVTFKSSPNYEAPGDAGSDNVYDVTVSVSDGTNVTTKDVAITVTNTNEAPTLTSAATANFAENGSGTVYTATATDPDAGTTLTYSISGADAALFDINATTGAVTFKSAPNYEAPADAGGDNVYDVNVTASDGTNATTQAVAVSVTNANEGPTITSGSAASFAENGTGTIYTASATDPDAGTTLTYSLSGADAALFNIDSVTGAVTFKSSPNYEAPGDAGGNNIYDVNVTVSDGTNATTQAVAITVTNVNEAPSFTSGAAASIAENATGTVYTAAATDPDAGSTITYSISGADAALFDINPTTGVVTFKSSPSYETPGDAGGDNVYDINVTASDETNASTQAVAITVTNVNEAPTFTSSAAASVAENATGTVYTAVATDADAGATIAYSLTGTDAALFDINATTGAVTFKSSPNYEAPADAGGNNVYDVTVVASDGTNITTKDVAISVTNVNEAPTVTSAATASFAENGSGTVYTAAATDPDAGTTLTYSISGADASLFNIDSVTGAVTFKSSPNYEAPGDTGGNNVYDVNVTASDGTNSATKAVAISVTNVNEAPTVTSAATASFAENATGTVYTAAATDPDAGATLTYSISGSDAALFNIDSVTGAITFKSTPNYEAPGDAGGDNVYNVTVGASDGSITTTKAVAITVTNVNEGPTVTSAGTASFAENATGTVYIAAATDPDAGTTLTYSISGADASLFNIDATTGAITFKSSPNYEAPGDAGSNNVYDVKVTASDGTLSSTKDVAITVTNVNEAPTITSAATASFAENGSGTVYTAAAVDPDAGSTLTYSISGTDASLFNINATTGAITFKSSPNYEAPGDAGSNNVYDVTVSASDGTLTTTKAVAITVTNVNEAPTITSAATASFAENGTGTVYTAAATDPDAGSTLTYSISGADAALFNINVTTGAVTFKSSPNYEAPGDTGGNNVYDINVIASDGTNATTQAVAISVTNVNEAPTFTSGAAASFAENATGTVYTAAAIDPDAGATLTYSISGADAALFNINATTGAVTFKSSPNYEAPTDAGGNNVYDVIVTASDGTNSATKAVAITVTNVNEAPTITSGAAANFAENGTGTVYTVAATDPDAGSTLTYSISGTDAALFNIDSVTGAVTFKSSPNYEAPGDAGGNNVYDVSVTASDGANSTTKAVAISVTNVNEAPTVTSAGTASFAENASGTVYTATATDPDAGTTLTYSISGADASLFNINATTGVVTFKSSPNYEAPGDTGGNNVYDISVTASDGTNSTTKAVAISVTNANEAPTITSGAAASFAENGTGTVYTAAATDPDAGTTLTYSISGADAALFNIDSVTGAVTFKSSPNYEAPTDAGGNNVYDITVGASDGTITTTKGVAITVTNVNEAPTVTSAGTASFAENASGAVYTAAATDPDAGTTLTYSISGTDASLFNIDSVTGVVTFKSAPNYEAPGDVGGNNVYDITVSASDGSLTTGKAVAITVTNVNEAPTVTSGAAASFAENATGTVYTAAATDPDAGTTLTYSISGVDASLFNINATTGAVTFKSAPNYEAPTDAGGNNVYDVSVTASDGSNSTTKAVAITVTNVNEAPTIISAATASFAENATGTVYTAAATDPDAGATLTYSLTGADASLFDINATTGVVTFKSAPNYEAPGDAGGNNVYDVSVTASDGTNSATKAVAISVTNVNEAPTVTSAATASFAENSAGTVYTAAATDPDAGATLTYSLTGADAALFNINSTTGVVTFKSSPNYEAPGDAGGNNVYDVSVTASDGTNSATKAVAISVTNVNEAPTVTSAATASFAENASGTVYTVAATDPDAGATLTYSLTGADAALFNINTTTGVVTFKSSPNYEAPGDAGGNNVYDITVGASDGTNSTTKAVAISVTNVNEAPTVTSSATASFAENGTGTVYTIAATDPDAGTTLTYSLTGADAALFNINSTTGVVTFKSSPNYEAPTDAGGNNVYDITVGASDGTTTTTKAVAITVNNVNEAPTGITVTGPLSVQETVVSGGNIGTAYNPGAVQPIIATLSASDPEGGTMTYSLVGAPAGLFIINGNQIQVASGASFDYETTPSYALTVRATDSTGLTFDQVVNINIANYAGSYTGTNGANTANGTSEEDTISGGGGNDILNGNDGNDILNGGAGSDVLNGGAGYDTVTYATATAGVVLSFSPTDGNGIGSQYANLGAGGISGEASGDSFSGIEAFIGTAFADTVGGGSTDMTFTLGDGNDIFDTNAAYTVADVVYGGNGNDTMWTGEGNDSLYGGAGDDMLYGEGGTDTAFYSDATSGVTVSLAVSGAQNTGGAGTDTLSTIENLSGSDFADTLTGNSGDNSLWGGLGNDTLRGGSGNDTLYGGAGNDTMYGEAGADVFFLQAGLGNDTVAGGAGGSWIDALDLHDASGNSYAGAFPTDWTLVLTTGSITSTGTESLTLSTDSAGYVQHSDGTQVNFTEIEQIRW